MREITNTVPGGGLSPLKPVFSNSNGLFQDAPGDNGFYAAEMLGVPYNPGETYDLVKLKDNKWLVAFVDTNRYCSVRVVELDEENNVFIKGDILTIDTSDTTSYNMQVTCVNSDEVNDTYRAIIAYNMSTEINLANLSIDNMTISKGDTSLTYPNGNAYKFYMEKTEDDAAFLAWEQTDSPYVSGRVVQITSSGNLSLSSSVSISTATNNNNYGLSGVKISDAPARFVLAHRHSSYYMYLHLVTVDGTTISVNTKDQFNNSWYRNNDRGFKMLKINDNKVLVLTEGYGGYNGANSNDLFAGVVDITATPSLQLNTPPTILFGVNNANHAFNSMAIKKMDGNFLVASGTPRRWFELSVDVNTNDITVDKKYNQLYGRLRSNYEVENVRTFYELEPGKFMVTMSWADRSNYVYGFILDTNNLKSDWVGFAKNSSTIIEQGIIRGMSGLSTGKEYVINPKNSELKLKSSSEDAALAIPKGYRLIALSESEMLIKKGEVL